MVAGQRGPGCEEGGQQLPVPAPAGALPPASVAPLHGSGGRPGGHGVALATLPPPDPAGGQRADAPEPTGTLAPAETPRAGLRGGGRTPASGPPGLDHVPRAQGSPAAPIKGCSPSDPTRLGSTRPRLGGAGGTGSLPGALAPDSPRESPRSCSQLGGPASALGGLPSQPPGTQAVAPSASPWAGGRHGHSQPGCPLPQAHAQSSPLMLPPGSSP